jgi:hypothetical protein
MKNISIIAISSISITLVSFAGLMTWVTIQRDNQFQGKYGFLWHAPKGSMISIKQAGPYSSYSECKKELEIGQKNGKVIRHECSKN